ncbi:MAG: LacI family transcriptional regulator [Lentisphaerae bacterium]|nr:LacI family transcriptional regulator [Lentisphaerota bacterium]
MNQRDIAKAVGVSQVAVSLVLRSPQTTRVSAAKKAKIIAALRENGFLNSAGTKRSWAAGFITDEFQSRNDTFIHDAVCGAEEELNKSYYNVIFEVFRNKELNIFKNRQVDGVIVRSGKALEYLLKAEHQLPVVLLNCALPGVNADTVMPDNRGGILTLCQRLIQKGFRRIAFLGASPAYSPYSCNYSERLSAYLEYCVNSDITPLWANIPLPVENAPENIAAAAGIISQWESDPHPPDAVITANYLYGALLAHLRPTLAVAAGDNKKSEDLPGVPRFVLEQDSRTMGAFAAELLLQRIANPERKHVRLDCEVSLQGQ